MPALDQCHFQMVRALEKAGGLVSEKPLTLGVRGRVVHIDIRASRPINGRTTQLMLAEVKCFADPNTYTRDLQMAFGQYVIYRAMLSAKKVIIPIYLAVPLHIYKTEFDLIIHEAIAENKFKLLVVDLAHEQVVQWIE